MGGSNQEYYPIVPLPYNTVLFPGRTLHISPANRPDIVAIITNYYSNSLKARSKEGAALLGCVPLRSPYLSADGKKLLEHIRTDTDKNIDQVVGLVKKDDMFHYGVLAKISGIRGGKAGDLALVVEGESRIKLDDIIQDRPYFEAHVTIFRDQGQRPSLRMWTFNLGLILIMVDKCSGRLGSRRERSLCKSQGTLP